MISCLCLHQVTLPLQEKKEEAINNSLDIYASEIVSRKGKAKHAQTHEQITIGVF